MKRLSTRVLTLRGGGASLGAQAEPRNRCARFLDCGWEPTSGHPCYTCGTNAIQILEMPTKVFLEPRVELAKATACDLPSSLVGAHLQGCYLHGLGEGGCSAIRGRASREWVGSTVVKALLPVLSWLSLNGRLPKRRLNILVRYTSTSKRVGRPMSYTVLFPYNSFSLSGAASSRLVSTASFMSIRRARLAQVAQPVETSAIVEFVATAPTQWRNVLRQWC